MGRPINHVDLCSGIGGFALGFEWAGLSHPVQFCDIEPWSRKILKKHWPDVPIAEDVKELASDPERLVSNCDILTSGYPCQPFSVAGKQKGFEDDRHIWPYILKIVAHKRPTWCVFENVYGHVALGLDQVLLDLENESYATRTFIVPACGVNAPHRRDRLWIVGNAQHDGPSTAKVRGVNEEDARGSSQGQSQTEQSSRASGREDDVNVADTSNKGLQGRLSGRSNSERQSKLGHSGRGSSAYGQSGQNWWAVEPNIRRVADGIPRRVDRLKGLGNAIVPQIAMNIGLAIKEELKQHG